MGSDKGTLQWEMLNKFNRRYFINKVKKPLRLAIVAIAKRYPEPTRENCNKPESLFLLDARDEFFKHQPTNTSRGPLLIALWKILICEVEHDGFYRTRLVRTINSLIELGWLDMGFDDKPKPKRLWKE